MRGSEHGAMVISFRPDKSHLIFHVNTDTTVAPVASLRMPPDAPLPRSEVNFLMRWIKEGAKNDADQVPFAQHSVAVSRTGRYISVASENVSAPDTPHHPVAGLKTPGIVAVIDAFTYRVVKRIEVGSFAAGIAPSP